MEEESTKPGSSSGSKKRERRATNANQAPKSLENQMILLSNDDIVLQIEPSHQPKKGRVDKVDRRCPQPSQEEIDAGFVFGWSFVFQVTMEKVKPPSLETTKQQILSAENTRIGYLKLRSGKTNVFALLTLHPIFYIHPNNRMDNGTFEVRFKKKVSKTKFLEALNSIEGKSIEQKKDALLPNIIWEPVDGQHIQHTCTLLIHQDLLGDHLMREEYETIFMK